MRFALLLLLAGAAPAGAANSILGSWEQAKNNAREAYGRSDYRATREALNAALEIAGSFGSDDVRFSVTLGELGGLSAEQGQFREAERYFLRALSRWPKSAERDARRSDMLAGLGTIYYQTREFSKAAQYEKMALELSEQTLGPKDATLAAPLNNLALILEAEHRYDEAEAALERALGLLEMAGRANDPVAAHLHNTLGMLRTSTGHPESAISEVNRAIGIWERTLAMDHPRVATGLTNLATLYCRTHRWAEGEEPIRRAREIITKNFGDEHPALDPILRTYADVLRHTGRKHEARQLEESADKIREQSRTDNAIGYTLDARSFGK